MRDVLPSLVGPPLGQFRKKFPLTRGSFWNLGDSSFSKNTGVSAPISPRTSTVKDGDVAVEPCKPAQEACENVTTEGASIGKAFH